MASSKVSELPAVSSVAGTEEVPVNQGGTSKKATVAQLVSALTAAASASGTDVLPAYQGSALKKVTVAQLQAGLAAETSGLSAASSVAGTDLLPVTQGSTAKKATLDQLVSGLAAASSVAGTDELHLSQGGTSKKATLAQAVTGLAAASSAASTDELAVSQGGTLRRATAAHLRTLIRPPVQTALDASVLHRWALTGASPFANTGTHALTLASQGTIRSRLGIWGAGMDVPGTGRDGIYGGAGDATADPGNAFTIDFWLWLRAYTAASSWADKEYKNDNTWATPYRAIGIGSSGSADGSWLLDCTTAGPVAHQITVSVNDKVLLGVWQHVGMTYDGANVLAYLNGDLVSTTAVTGNVAYGTDGPWCVGARKTSGAGTGALNGRIQDVRVATVARAASYFSNIWQQAFGLGL